MNRTQSRLAALGVGIPEILLPRRDIDLSKWAVIACDQFTQDRNYWEQVKKTAGAAPSCLNMIFPEVYLNDGRDDKGGADTRTRRIRDIHACMNSYIKGDVFAAPKHCCMYVERSTPERPKRRGLVLAIDLEQYDWKPGSTPLIRSTEGTVQERLPARMEIRRNAPLELPHILLLIDDAADSLILALGETARKNQPLYETSLMMNSGAITGWALDNEEALAILADGLETLAAKSVTCYADSGSAPDNAGSSFGNKPFLFAVGDGNHSLASAKGVWEEYKKTHANEGGLESHPARWALVEVENLYDPGIVFEPIHRVIFGVEPSILMEGLSRLKNLKSRPESPGSRIIRIESLSPEIATASLQPFLDNFVKQKGCSIDYIHGEDEVLRLASDPARHAVGTILPPVQKEGLFKTVARTGPLPRKSFSMGEAEEKRFYLECRKLFG